MKYCRIVRRYRSIFELLIVGDGGTCNLSLACSVLLVLIQSFVAIHPPKSRPSSSQSSMAARSGGPEARSGLCDRRRRRCLRSRPQAARSGRPAIGRCSCSCCCWVFLNLDSFRDFSRAFGSWSDAVSFGGSGAERSGYALPNQPMFDDPRFKLLIVGDKGTGKTTFVKRLLREDFEEIYELCTNLLVLSLRITATTGIEVYPLHFFTNRGMIRFDCSDTPGQGLRDGYYIRGQCAIIMFDVTAGSTYMNVPGWHRDLCRVCENIPIVLCGNKVDGENRQVEAGQFTYGWSNNLQHYEISARNMYNLEEPFLYLARELVGYLSKTCKSCLQRLFWSSS
ncbi:hypothetical protein EUGRSUZ_C01294 [Eucalyptus grandis]|uniref:GTP-binding nuclear protein n=2 Tax=Eucalyptus grandis TaxID=71139 RepID=A0A059CPX2_EUCGR|nr:hypothetical protein EUGRSUZ_C01294 [Eucalyptus grandis]